MQAPRPAAALAILLLAMATMVPARAAGVALDPDLLTNTYPWDLAHGPAASLRPRSSSASKAGLP
jgi:hypothetical protein